MGTRVYGFRVGIMEKKMEIIIVYRGYVGIMENTMEAILTHQGLTGVELSID